MKILITTDCYKPMINGVVTSINSLEGQLRKLGHEVKVLCPSTGFKSYESDNEYRMGSIGAKKIYNGARMAYRIRKSDLRSVIAWRPDIIHSQSEFTSFVIAKRIAQEVGCPIVHTYHTIYEDYTHYFSPSVVLGRKTVVMLTRKLIAHTDAVIAPTEKIRNLLYDYGIIKSVSVIPTGLELDKFSVNFSENELDELKTSLGIQKGSRVLITVGRAAKEKNISELIKYFKRLDLENTVLLIVGGGPYLETLMEEAQSPKIIFTGIVEPSEIARYYKLGDIFLSASQSETQGLTYIEALASGLPAVCRKDDCLNGVVSDYKNGGQYTDFESFSKFVLGILGDENLRERMSKQAVLTAGKYSSLNFALSALTLYDDVLNAYDYRHRICG